MGIVASTRKNICDHGTSLKHLYFKAATDCQRTRLPFFFLLCHVFFLFFLHGEQARRLETADSSMEALCRKRGWKLVSSLWCYVSSQLIRAGRDKYALPLQSHMAWE